MPSLKSSNLSTSALKIGLGISSLGSLPGFINSFIISCEVGSPTFNSVASSLIFLLLFNSASSDLISTNFSLFVKSFNLYPILLNKFSATL